MSGFYWIDDSRRAYVARIYGVQGPRGGRVVLWEAWCDGRQIACTTTRRDATAALQAHLNPEPAPIVEMMNHTVDAMARSDALGVGTMNNQFPDYDNAPLFAWCLSQLAPLGAVDSSHHNDAAPSISIETPSGRLSLHVDYTDMHKRDLPRLPSLYLYHDTIGDCGTESPREAIRLFAAMLYRTTIARLKAAARPRPK